MDLFNVLFNVDDHGERLATGKKQGNFVTLGEGGDRRVVFMDGPGQGTGVSEESAEGKISLPPSDYVDGPGKRLTSFANSAGQEMQGKFTRFGPLVLQITKTGSSSYARLYTADGYFVGIGVLRASTPVTGRIRSVHEAVKQVARVADWSKLAGLHKKGENTAELQKIASALTALIGKALSENKLSVNQYGEWTADRL